MSNYEELFRKKYVEEQKKIYLELFGSENTKTLELPKNYREYLKIGIDRLSLDIKYNDLKESTRDLKNIRIQGEFFNFFKTGKFKGNFYCKLDINLPRNLYGTNIKNVRDKKLIIKSFSKAFDELKDMGIIISKKSIVEYMEINKYIILDEPIHKMEQTFTIIRKNIVKGHFSREDRHYNRSKNKTGAMFGTINKSITFYSKILEILKLENLDDISFVSLRKIVSKFKEFLRFEIKLKNNSLENVLSRKLTLEELLESPEDVIDEIFEKIVIESGFTEESLEVNLDKSVKMFLRIFKRYKRVHERSFILRFVKDYSCKLWGGEQLEMIANQSSDSKFVRRDRKRSLKKEFKATKDSEIDCMDCIKKVIKDLDFF
ncbi:MAG: hypothetical protein WBG30_08800 [Psychrilyobacter sp.]|uniref:hypothetical protein n=1 Tax=Psychrilyobacter sp. TaxID=2586924 RepID=UPI003C774421